MVLVSLLLIWLTRRNVKDDKEFEGDGKSPLDMPPEDAQEEI